LGEDEKSEVREEKLVDSEFNQSKVRLGLTFYNLKHMIM